MASIKKPTNGSASSVWALFWSVVICLKLSLRAVRTTCVRTVGHRYSCPRSQFGARSRLWKAVIVRFVCYRGRTLERIDLRITEELFAAIENAVGDRSRNRCIEEWLWRIKEIRESAGALELNRKERNHRGRPRG